MNKLNKAIDNGIASLKALRDSPQQGTVFQIIEEIKALNNINVSDLKKVASCGHCSSGLDCNDSCDVWHMDDYHEQEMNDFTIAFNIEASDSEDAILTEISITRNEPFEEIELNKGELFWIEKAIQEKLAY